MNNTLKQFLFPFFLFQKDKPSYWLQIATFTRLFMQLFKIDIVPVSRQLSNITHILFCSEMHWELE